MDAHPGSVTLKHHSGNEQPSLLRAFAGWSHPLPGNPSRFVSHINCRLQSPDTVRQCDTGPFNFRPGLFCTTLLSCGLDSAARCCFRPWLCPRAKRQAVGSSSLLIVISNPGLTVADLEPHPTTPSPTPLPSPVLCH